MGYEAKEPVALCDGCKKPLYEGDKFYCFDWTERNTIHIWGLIDPDSLELQEFGSHYCRITPCLERAVVNELRKIHGVYHQATAPDPNPLPAQDAR